MSKQNYIIYHLPFGFVETDQKQWKEKNPNASFLSVWIRSFHAHKETQQTFDLRDWERK